MEIKVNNTFFTGKFLLHLPSVDSTNNYAKDFIAKSSPIDGTVILADEQYAGRGQAGNQWLSEPNKNLTFSIIYNTSFLLATEQFYLNMAVSLGIWSVVRGPWSMEGSQRLTTHESPQTTKIKWPNDILLNDKKIAGILIENTISGMHLKYSVIGIGINVNQDNFPAELHAISLKRLSDKEEDIQQLLSNLLASVEKYYMLLRERKFDRLKNEYVENLYRYRVTSTFEEGDTVFEGKIIGIEETGGLLVETDSGIRKFGFREIRFVK